jgi:flagellar biogenesis protein FliO
MKKLILICLFSILAFAGNLIDVNFFPHKTFTDVLFSFDSKFNGKIEKLSKNSYYISGEYTSKIIDKKFENANINEIKISPYANGIKIEIFPKGKDKISFALTPEGYGIRMRIKSPLVMQKNDSLQALMAKNPENSIDYTTYFIMLAILIILAIILWIIKKRAPKLPMKKSELKMGVLIQKPIDAKNKIVLFEFNKRKYLILVGNTNLLIDVFDENLVNINTPKDFDEFLKVDSRIEEVKKYIKNAEELKEFDEKI